MTSDGGQARARAIDVHAHVVVPEVYAVAAQHNVFSGLPTDPGATLYDTNNVNIRLANGSNPQVGYDTGLHPFRNQYLLGPFNWTQDASMLKFFNLTERARLRLNVDVFNVFNTQGLNTPGSDGVVTLQNSYGGFGMRPRQVQVGMRMEW